jgi:hypothetical protein
MHKGPYKAPNSLSKKVRKKKLTRTSTIAQTVGDVPDENATVGSASHFKDLEKCGNYW